ncbi:uncharacterized protein LOC115243274 [Formica exsecta]|uniref:uncharacterized protein LOC115243274 n=1 Tax=Formica exsecta TaxID=72781 RepID=UPI00114350E8|nr:uncharacterized protein LOC115243274 [Formica exsecta]
MTAIVCNTEVSKSSDWFLDSGATRHMCNDYRKFTVLNDTEKFRVFTAAEHCLDSSSTGEINLEVKNRGSKNTVNLKDAMLIPALRNNLMSVSMITDNGYTVVFDKNSATIKRRDGSTALTTTKRNQLYVVNETKNHAMAVHKIYNDKLTRWHQRYGHLNVADLKNLKIKEMLKGVEFTTKTDGFQCEICDQNKLHVQPFKPSKNRETEVLNLIHSDICGPMNVESLEGSRLSEITKEEWKTKQDNVSRNYARTMGKNICPMISKNFWRMKASLDNFLWNILRNRTVLQNAQIGRLSKWQDCCNNLDYRNPYGPKHKVIALNKGPKRGKFFRKGDEYVLVRYSDEAKAYRLWKPRTKTVIKSRDIKFYEKLHSCNYDWDDLTKNDSNNNINEKGTLKIKSMPLLTDLQDSEANEEITNEYDQQLEDNDSEDEVDEVPEEREENGNKDLQRGRGRPKLLKTGQRGRPKKMYQKRNDANHNPMDVAEAMNRSDRLE